MDIVTRKKLITMKIEKKEKLKVGIIGAVGYAGEQLISLLLKHPDVEISALSDKMDGKPADISEIFPHLKGKINLECSDLDLEEFSKKADLFFLALPHSVSLSIVPELLKFNKKVIDLSADFRLKDLRVYNAWYGVKHNQEALLKEAVYGLPELYRDKIEKSRIVANPGCYPTSIILGCAPLFKNGLVKGNSVIADSKSGYTGAGRKFAQEKMSEISGNFKAYNIAKHRHIPEIEQELTVIAKKNISLMFTPHIMSIPRGILSSVYMEIKGGLNEGDVLGVYNKFYEREPFVKVLKEGFFPEIKDVVDTNYVHIGVRVANGMAVVIVAIDNLVKGASGQAIQNMNLMCGLGETAGLL